MPPRIIIPRPGVYLDDTGLIVIEDVAFARRFLQECTAATSGAAGLGGAIPGAAAGENLRAYRGDKVYADTLELSAVKRADGVPIFDFENLDDASDRLYSAAAGSGTHRTRLGARSSVDTWIDLVLEPLGTGSRVTREGDPLWQTMKPIRCISAMPGTDTFHTVGLPTPTIYSPGAAPAALLGTSAEGYFTSLTYDFETNAAAGISTPNCTMRQQLPSVYMVFRTAIVESRMWFGLFDGDPSGSATLGSIKGVGARFDNAIDSNIIQFVTSSGSAQTTTATAIAPVANAIQAWRVQALGGANWMFATYNFTTLAWLGFITQNTNPPGPTDPLGIHAKVGTTSTSTADRVFSPKTIALYGS